MIKPTCNYTKKVYNNKWIGGKKPMKKGKKRHLKKWVLYAIYIIAMMLFFIIADKMGLIRIYRDSIDITALTVIITAWECLKASVKACYNREKETSKI